MLTENSIYVLIIHSMYTGNFILALDILVWGKFIIWLPGYWP